MNEDRGGWIAFLIAAIVVAACVLALCGCLPVEDAPAAMLPPDEVETTEHAPGMPLDACEVIEYDRPIWLPDCQHAYKVYDRITGDAWWLLDMGYDHKAREYVVLPLDEKED